MLTDYQSTLKNAITGEYFDLCKGCFEDIKPFVKVIDRKDLITEQDLDDPLEDDTEMDTQASLEDYEDIIDTLETLRDYDEH